MFVDFVSLFISRFILQRLLWHVSINASLYFCLSIICDILDESFAIKCVNISKKLYFLHLLQILTLIDYFE